MTFSCIASENRTTKQGSSVPMHYMSRCESSRIYSMSFLVGKLGTWKTGDMENRGQRGRSPVSIRRKTWGQTGRSPISNRSQVVFCDRGQRQRPLRKKYTWLVQSIPPALSASEIRARTSPPISAGEIVFSSTNITPPWDRPSSAQSFNNGGIVLRSYVTRVKRCFAASNRQTESSFPRKFPLSHCTMEWITMG